MWPRNGARRPASSQFSPNQWQYRQEGQRDPTPTGCCQEFLTLSGKQKSLGNVWTFKLFSSRSWGPHWWHTIVWISHWNPNLWASWSPSLMGLQDKETNTLQLTFHFRHGRRYPESGLATGRATFQHFSMWHPNHLHQSCSWSMFKMCVRKAAPCWPK